MEIRVEVELSTEYDFSHYLLFNIQFLGPEVTLFGSSRCVSQVELSGVIDEYTSNQCSLKTVTLTKPPWQVYVLRKSFLFGSIIFVDGSSLSFLHKISPNSYHYSTLEHSLRFSPPDCKLIEYVMKNKEMNPTEIRITTLKGHPEKFSGVFVNGYSVQQCSVSPNPNEVGTYLLTIQNNGETYTGTWCGDTFKASLLNPMGGFVQWMMFFVDIEELPDDHILNYLKGQVSLIMDALQSAYKKQIPGYNLLSNEDPIPLMEKMCGVDIYSAAHIANILSEIIQKHQNVASWEPQVEKLGVPTFESETIKNPPVCTLSVSFKDCDPTQNRSKIFEASYWKSYVQLQKSIEDHLILWETTARGFREEKIIREYQLSAEKKFPYSYSKVTFLLCCKYSPMLQRVPKEIIQIICSHLPLTLYGCLNFGYQQFNISSFKSEYLIVQLNAETYSFKIMKQVEDQRMVKRIQHSGTWRLILSGTMTSPQILFENVIGTETEYSRKLKNEKKQRLQNMKGDIYRDKKRGVLLSIKEVQLYEMSSWEMEQILTGRTNFNVNA